MKQSKSLFIKAVSLSIAAAIFLTGCSTEEVLEVSAGGAVTAGTTEHIQPESSSEAANETSMTAVETDEETSEETEEEIPVETAETTSEETEAATTTAEAATTTTAETTTTATTTTTTAAITSATTTAVTTTTIAATTTTIATTTTTAATTTTTTAVITTAPSVIIGGTDTAQVYNTLISFKSVYPEGLSWTNENRSYKSYTVCPEYEYFEGKGCSAFALELSDAAFGGLPRREHYDVSAIRVGDIIRLDGNHSVIVLEVRDSGVVIAEGNYNSSVHWERELTYDEIRSSLTYIWTRYADS